MTGFEFLLGVIGSFIASIMFEAARMLLRLVRGRAASQPQVGKVIEPTRFLGSGRVQLGGGTGSAGAGWTRLSEGQQPNRTDLAFPDGEGPLERRWRILREVLEYWQVFGILYIVSVGPAIIWWLLKQEVFYFDQAFRPPAGESVLPWLLPHEAVTPGSLRLLLILTVVYAVGLLLTEVLARRAARMTVQGIARNVPSGPRVSAELLNAWRRSIARALLGAVAVVALYAYFGDSIVRGFFTMYPAISSLALPITLLLPVVAFLIILWAEFKSITRAYKHGGKYE